MLRNAPNIQRLCWRSWPCPKCSKGLTPIGFLFKCIEAGPDIRKDSIEKVIATRRDWLVKWVKSCSHSHLTELSLPKIAEGSEHSVFFNEKESVVYKLTLLDVFGDSYYLSNGAVYQEKSDPLEYLLRLRLWDKIFRPGPECLGITEQGQIVSKLKFISGLCPQQEEVDEFLISAGLIAVKQNCWLWKKDYEEFSVWVGDARADNFVSSLNGIIPIDLRLWFAPLE